MWVVAELLRLVFRVAFAAAIAILLAALLSLVSSGGFDRNLRIMFFLVGGLLILLAGAGNRSSTTNRMLSWENFSGIRGYSTLFPAIRVKPGQPTLTASAVFVGSGAVLIFLGFLV
jgi:hypothetical protein